MASLSSAKSSIKDVLLSDQSTWDSWFEIIKGACPKPLWQYFDPDSEVVFIEPIKPIAPSRETTPETPPPPSGPSTKSSQTATGETAEELEARETRNARALDTHIKLLNIWRIEKKEWDEYHAMVTKLRGIIQGSVAVQKAARLRSELPVRTWLKQLKETTAPAQGAQQRSVLTEYTKFIHHGLNEWPSGGPGPWIAKWENLTARAERYKVPLPLWLTDVSTVWKQVTGLTGYFDTVERHFLQGKEDKYSVQSVSSAIQYAWERKKEGTAVKFPRQRTTRSVFTAAEEATFNGEEAPEADTPAPKSASSSTRKKSNKKRSRARGSAANKKDDFSNDEPSPKRSDNKKEDEYPCSACGGKNRTYKKCFLVYDKDQDWIPQENRDKFKENMKKPSLKRKVEGRQKWVEKRRKERGDDADADE